MSQFDEKVKEFEVLQAEIVELHRSLENKKAEYCAKMKATFGIADGEQTNALDLVKVVKAVRDLAATS